MAEFIFGYWLVEPVEEVTFRDDSSGVERLNQSTISTTSLVLHSQQASSEIGPFVVAKEVVTARFLEAASSASISPEHHHSSGCVFSPPPTQEIKPTGWAGGWDSRTWSSTSTVSGICISVKTETV